MDNLEFVFEKVQELSCDFCHKKFRRCGAWVRGSKNFFAPEIAFFLRKGLVFLVRLK